MFGKHAVHVTHTCKLINVIQFFKSDNSNSFQSSCLCTECWASCRQGRLSPGAGALQKATELPAKASDLHSSYPLCTCARSGSGFPRLSQQTLFSFCSCQEQPSEFTQSSEHRRPRRLRNFPRPLKYCLAPEGACPLPQPRYILRLHSLLFSLSLQWPKWSGTYYVA